MNVHVDECVWGQVGVGTAALEVILSLSLTLDPDGFHIGHKLLLQQSLVLAPRVWPCQALGQGQYPDAFLHLFGTGTLRLSRVPALWIIFVA